MTSSHGSLNRQACCTVQDDLVGAPKCYTRMLNTPNLAAICMMTLVRSTAHPVAMTGPTARQFGPDLQAHAIRASVRERGVLILSTPTHLFSCPACLTVGILAMRGLTLAPVASVWDIISQRDCFVLIFVFLFLLLEELCWCDFEFSSNKLERDVAYIFDLFCLKNCVLHVGKFKSCNFFSNCSFHGNVHDTCKISLEQHRMQAKTGPQTTRRIKPKTP